MYVFGGDNTQNAFCLIQVSSKHKLFKRPYCAFTSFISSEEMQEFTLAKISEVAKLPFCVSVIIVDARAYGADRYVLLLGEAGKEHLFEEQVEVAVRTLCLVCVAQCHCFLAKHMDEVEVIASEQPHVVRRNGLFSQGILHVFGHAEGRLPEELSIIFL